MRTRDAFHKLIDKIDNEEILKGYFELIQRLNSNQTGRLSDSLTSEEKNELLLSYEESFDPRNLVSHEDVKGQHDKWLKKIVWTERANTKFNKIIDYFEQE